VTATLLRCTEIDGPAVTFTVTDTVELRVPSDAVTVSV